MCAYPAQTSTPGKTIIGSGQFLFAPGYTGASGSEWADAETASDVINFGDVKVTRLQRNKETAKRYNSIGGVRKVDRTTVTLAELMYAIKFDEFSADAMEMLFFGTKEATPGTAKSGYTEIDPMAAPHKTGLGVIRMFDPDDPTSEKMIHEHFGCSVSADGEVEIGPENFAEFDLLVEVTSPDGKAYVRGTT